MIKVALIGVTGYGALYLSQLLRLKEEKKVDVVGVTVVNPQRAGDQIAQLEAMDCPVFSDVNTMFERLTGEIDLCCIPTGIDSHASLTIQALQEGCNVLVEKPAAASLQDIEKMKKVQWESGLEVFVGFQHLYNPEVQRLKQQLLEGVVGEVQNIRMQGLWPRDTGYFSRNDWAGKLSLNGNRVLDSPANNAFAHDLMLMLYLGGSAQNSTAGIESMQAELYRTYDIESFDTGCMRFITVDGITILYLVTHSCKEIIGPIMEIQGTKGKIVFGYDEFALHNGKGASEFGNPRDEKTARQNMFDTMVRKFNGEDVFVCDLEVAEAHTACISAVHELFDINPISRDNLFKQPIEAESQNIINNIESIFAEAFRECKLPGEMNVSWARESKLVAQNPVGQPG